MALLADADRARLRRQLEARAAQLRAEIEGERRLANHYEETDDDAVADLETGIDVSALERDVDELAAVEAALARIGGAGYGECIDCAAAIPLARLEANPAATRCTACQAAWERAHAGHTPTL